MQFYMYLYGYGVQVKALRIFLIIYSYYHYVPGEDTPESAEFWMATFCEVSRLLIGKMILSFSDWD